MYFFPFFYSFFITVALIFLILWACSRFEFLKRAKNLANRKENVCRFGGAAIIIGFLLTLFLNKELFISEQLWGIIIAALFILVFGLSDDFLGFDWKTQLLFQVSVAILIFILGVRVEFITNPLGGFIFLNLGKYLIPSFIFVAVWIVMIINSMNWIDGIDGLSGGISLIGAITIFLLSLKPEVNQPPVGIIAIALSGSLLGFLIFNFYPSKIIAGTSGSVFMGFILASLSIFAGAKIATALLVMAVPLIDSVWVIGERVKNRKSIFKPDKRHLHYKLLELGWSHQKIALLLYSATLCIAIIALNTRATGKMITMVLVTAVIVSYLIFINKKLSNLKNNLGKRT